MLLLMSGFRKLKVNKICFYSKEMKNKSIILIKPKAAH